MANSIVPHPDGSEPALSSAQDAAADARLKALFAEAGRPPMADERFTSVVMAQVEAQSGRAKQWRLAAAVGGLSIMGALLAPYLGLGAVDAVSALKASSSTLPVVGAGGVTLVLAAAACAAGWVLAERA